jgi:hypothetical protein
MTTYQWEEGSHSWDLFNDAESKNITLPAGKMIDLTKPSLAGTGWSVIVYQAGAHYLANPDWTNSGSEDGSTWTTYVDVTINVSCYGPLTGGATPGGVDPTEFTPPFDGNEIWAEIVVDAPPEPLPFSTDGLVPLPDWMPHDTFGNWYLVWRVHWGGGLVTFPPQTDPFTGETDPMLLWGWVSHGPDRTLAEYGTSDTVMDVEGDEPGDLAAGFYDVYAWWATGSPDPTSPILPAGMTLVGAADPGDPLNGGGGGGGDDPPADEPAPYGTTGLSPLPRWVFGNSLSGWYSVWRVAWAGGDLEWPDQYNNDTGTTGVSNAWGWFSHGPNTTLAEYYESDTLGLVRHDSPEPFDAGEYDIYSYWFTGYADPLMPILPEGMTFVLGPPDDGGGGGGGGTFDPAGPTTDEFWEIDGQALNTWAWNIESWGGDRRSVPPLRGSNVLLPFRPGERWIPKVAGARTMTLGMWVLGCDADGDVPPEMRGRFNDNWRALQRLMWRTDRQMTLTRRTRRSNGSIAVQDALVEFAGGLEPSTEVPGRAKFTVDLRLADPYFRPRDSITRTFTSGGGTVTNPGDDTVLDMTIVFGGAGTLTNTTTGLSLHVPFAGTVDTKAFTAVRTSDGTSMVSAVVTNRAHGALEWMHLRREDNVFTWDGIGTVGITFTPVYV